MTARMLDARVLLALARGQPRTGTHAERLAAFYAPQAAHYDDFRARLLAGRSELIERMAVRDGADVVELGGGTGFNLSFFGDRLERLGSATVVDLCAPLLERAHARWAGHANVRIVEADATQWRPPAPLDAVYLSYALTMIPDWRAAIDNAVHMLKPGGTLGAVDFFVGENHGALTRSFWPYWFAHDGVRLSPEPLAHLRAKVPDHEVQELRASVPYLPGLRVPYYIFVGRKG